MSAARFYAMFLTPAVSAVHEDEVDGDDQQAEGKEMVPVQGFAFEKQYGEDGENQQRDDFLHDFQLQQRELAAVADESVAVCGHHEQVFKQCYSPRKQDN